MPVERPAIRYNVRMAPEPRANPLLLGHAQAEATLLEAMRAGRMHHAWLITGPDGVGKATLAYRFARRLLAGMPEGDTLALDPAHPVFRRVASSGHGQLGPHPCLIVVRLVAHEQIVAWHQRKRKRARLAGRNV